MASFSCRFANREDLEQLVVLRVLMQKEVNSADDLAIDAAYLEKVKQYFVRSLELGSYVSAVASVEGQLVGATGLVIYEKPPSLKGRNGRQGYITNVYTRPEWRGQGIATALMKLTVSHAKEHGVDKLYLGSREGTKAIYESVGFKPTYLPHLELVL